MKNLSALFKKSTKSRGRPGFGESPDADWKIIFITAVTLAFLATVLNIYIFIKIDKGEIFTVEESTLEGSDIPSLSKLRETVLYYQGKAKEFEKIKSANDSGFVDPSL